MNVRALLAQSLAQSKSRDYRASYVTTGRLFSPLNPNVEAHSGLAPVSFIFGKRHKRLMIAICPLFVPMAGPARVPKIRIQSLPLNTPAIRSGVLLSVTQSLTA